MGRKDFVADLRVAKQARLPPHFSDLVTGDEDGAFQFFYNVDQAGLIRVALNVCLDEISSYPREHNYFLFSDSENVPPRVQQAISDFSSAGMRIEPMLIQLSKHLDRASCRRPDGEGSEEELDDFPEEDPDDSDEHCHDDAEFDLGDEIHGQASINRAMIDRGAAPGIQRSMEEMNIIRKKACDDLKRAKKAGFRVAYTGSLLRDNTYLTISLRVARLGLQDDTLKAWDLDKSEYLMMIIQYKEGYRSLDEVANSAIGRDVEVRVLLNKNYKLSSAEAGHACLETEAKDNSNIPKNARELFIGRTINDLIKQRLSRILKFRLVMGFTWQGAEDFYNENQSRILDEHPVNSKYYEPDDLSHLEGAPKIVKADHLSDPGNSASFPLVAMQFALRHIVRCTEFCLVCHCRTGNTFEALRPYVCSNPLCLYQYMRLGFGPSIEHELLTQPHVVDLLVSFCYSAAVARRLRSTPCGMGLEVSRGMLLAPGFHSYPPMPSVHGSAIMPQRSSAKSSCQSMSRPMNPKITKEVDFEEKSSQLIFRNNTVDPDLYCGRWIQILAGKLPEQHRRVVRIAWPIVYLGPAVLVDKTEELEFAPPHLIKPAPTPPLENSLSPSITIQYMVWNCNIDDLDFDEQQAAICGLLRLLPSVTKMITYLKDLPERSRSLSKWIDRLPSSTLGVLRWIIASNRSCIVQVDDIHGNKSAEERVSGLPGYTQFRFATGAPDKESRFLEAVKTQTAANNLKHPTVFAWHGSPLWNWHNIVREGLRFDYTAHGRAYGNGVYHALQSQTSEGYSGTRSVGQSQGWQESELGINSALCLNEIVNVPSEFISRSPYLVVAQVDWIQTRYLFVKCDSTKELDPGSIPARFLEQDPAMHPTGNSGKLIEIPAKAIRRARQPSYSINQGQKRTKLSPDTEEDEAYMSDVSEEQDCVVLREERNIQDTYDDSRTKFTPGNLDHASLPLLHAPAYATSQATKALQRELKNILGVQDAQPQQELGWYLDPDSVNNVYQWIFEVHSFEKKLPLAMDMQKVGIQSVVLELRFGKNYPFSPPFVRVIRPRFLPFMNGGGGHVTAGGALCMELLTNDGWNPASTIEAVLLQVRMAISSTDPKPARLHNALDTDYSAYEAKEAYERACRAHGVSSLALILDSLDSDNA